MLRDAQPLYRITSLGGMRTLCHPRYVDPYWTAALHGQLERFEDTIWEIENGLPQLVGFLLDGTRVLLAQVMGEARGNFRVQVVR